MPKRRHHQHKAETALTATKTYVPKGHFEDGSRPNLVVVLRGLLLLAFDGTNQCEIGAVKLPEPAPNDQPHDFEIRIWEQADQCPGINEPDRSRIVPNDRFEIIVDSPAVYDGVYVFASDPPRSDPKDFGFVPDFEGDDFYGSVLNGQPLDKNPGIATPKIIINNGLVYAHRITQTEFQVLAEPEGSDQPKEIEQVADIVAIRIFLQPGGTIQLKEDGTLIDTVNADQFYQIDVLNRCHKDQHPACDFVPGSLIKTERNDFYLYYTAFQRPPGQPEYMLKAKPPFRRFSRLQGICHLRTEDTSDPAPCGAGVYGQSRTTG
ncbi:MAG TPA: hypothetical protein VJ464_23250 [Blastocatellia bacterium]|nr:hypothetical protein [Blastocatellia bacterium]